MLKYASSASEGFLKHSWHAKPPTCHHCMHAECPSRGALRRVQCAVLAVFAQRNRVALGHAEVKLRTVRRGTRHGVETPAKLSPVNIQEETCAWRLNLSTT